MCSLDLVWAQELSAQVSVAAVVVEGVFAEILAALGCCTVYIDSAGCVEADCGSAMIHMMVLGPSLVVV